MKTPCPNDNGLLFQAGPVGLWHCRKCKAFFSEDELEFLELKELATKQRELIEELRSGELSDTPWLDGEN